MTRNRGTTSRRPRRRPHRYILSDYYSLRPILTLVLIQILFLLVSGDIFVETEEEEPAATIAPVTVSTAADDHALSEQPHHESDATTSTTITANLTDWDAKIHDLEQKLETDLQKVEQDAHGISHNATTNLTTTDIALGMLLPTTDNETASSVLDRDLTQVRSDIHDLVSSIEAAEQEIERLKAKMELEERILHKKTANLRTEQILDDLHRGKKYNVKVDYVTGKLIANSKKERRIMSGEDVGAWTNETTTTNSLGAGVAGGEQGIIRVDGVGAVLSSVVNHNNATNATASTTVKTPEEEEDEKALEDIIEAASAKTKKKKQEIVGDDDLRMDEEKKEEPETDTLTEMDPELKSRVKEEIESLRTGADPAVLSFNMQLLVDIVKLAMTAAFFGLVAVFLKLPPTAGFLLGGMLIGPSFLDLIGTIHEVHTLAQFGSIFLLFEQGLLYSQTYSGAAVLGSTLSRGDGPEDDSPTGGDSSPSPKQSNSSLHSRRRNKALPTRQPSPSSMTTGSEHDPNIVGSIVLILLTFMTLSIVVLTDVVSSVAEAITVSCSIAICSTTIVSENLHATNLARTHWGHGVLKMIAMHDLFMVPLLALPELLASFVDFNGDENKDDDDTMNANDAHPEREWNGVGGVMLQIVLVAVLFKACMILGKHVVAAANFAQSRVIGEKGELFTLSIVAYALLIASLSDQLQLSIEAGAVLAGIALMKSPHVPKVLASIQPITSVFGGMYMTSLGMIISPMFVVEEASSIIQLVFLIGLFKLALVSTVLNRFFDYGITASLAVGSAMAQISEISLVVLAKAQRIGLVSRKTYLLLIPTTCIMLSLAPFSAAHLRRLKMQEVSGSDDGKIPYYLCFLKQMLRHPRHSPIPLHHSSSSNHEMEEVRVGSPNRTR